ncbi:MAG: hypothetical protein OEV94_07315 [Deltaproteobacteria bacterium]|nr:hypothetical protein [Deltaproteobacteria bacterium]
MGQGNLSAKRVGRWGAPLAVFWMLLFVAGTTAWGQEEAGPSHQNIANHPGLEANQHGDAPDFFEYGVDLASNNVQRGMDFHAAAFAPNPDGAINSSPAIQPSFTLHHNKSGMFFRTWGTFALVKRDILSPMDQIDYTLGFQFKNKYGEFEAGLLTSTNPLPNTPVMHETYMSAALDWSTWFSPSLTHFIDTTACTPTVAVPAPTGTCSETYDLLQFGGGEGVVWQVGGEFVAAGPRYYSASLGWEVDESVTLSVNAVHRPNMTLTALGYPTVTTPNGPPDIVWFVVSVHHSVKDE